MTTPIKGIDISAWQHPDDKPIDWAEVAEDGIRFVIIKATQGLDYVNPWLSVDAMGAHKAGLAIGLYHFAMPNPGETPAGDSALQAQFACLAADGLPLSLGIALDIEEAGALEPYQLSDWCKGFIAGITGRHHWCPVYTGGDFANQLTGLPWGQRLWWDEPECPAMYHPYMVQTGSGYVNGVIGDCDMDTLLLSRAINPPLPGSTRARGNADVPTMPTGDDIGTPSSGATVPESSQGEPTGESPPDQAE